MIRFLPVDAALEGFRITREHPRAVAGWVALLIVANLFGQAFIAMMGAGPAVAALAALTPQSPLEQRTAAIGAAAPALSVLLLIGVLLQSALFAALYRAVLEPTAAAARRGFLRLGADELRQLGVLLLIAAALAAWVFLLLVAGGVLTAAAAAAPGVVGGLLKAAVMVAVFLAVLYPAVRLSLAPAMTFAERRVVLFRAWPLTAGQFWALFGAYVLAGLLAVLVALLSMIVFSAVGVALGALLGQRIDVLTGPGGGGAEVASLRAVLSPANLLILVFSAASTTLAFVIVNAVAPAALRGMRGGAPLRAGAADLRA